MPSLWGLFEEPKERDNSCIMVGSRFRMAVLQSGLMPARLQGCCACLSRLYHRHSQGARCMERNAEHHLYIKVQGEGPHMHGLRQARAFCLRNIMRLTQPVQ